VTISLNFRQGLYFLFRDVFEGVDLAAIGQRNLEFDLLSRLIVRRLFLFSRLLSSGLRLLSVCRRTFRVLPVTDFDFRPCVLITFLDM
jgi:hypothetical protein